MKKIMLCTSLMCTSMWGAASEKVEKKEEAKVGEVLKVDASNINTVVGILSFMQQAKATQSMPDKYTPNRVGYALRTVHLMNPLRFEQVYGDLTTELLAWTEQNLLLEKPKE